MSTFNGIIKEIPYIRVDRFDNNAEDSSVFFISHCHTDHMTGLNEYFFNMLQHNKLYLYGSPISVKILKSIYPQYENQLKELFVGESTSITTTYNEECVCLSVHPIPAGHCPGSVMFLLEFDKARVLYTGDFRIDNMKEFFDIYFPQAPRIDNIYLDTTFFKKQYPHFPSRKESLDRLCDIIQSWLSIDDRNIIHITMPARFGSEFLIKEISKKTMQKIHVPDITYDLHKFIPDMEQYVVRYDDQKDIKIHIGQCDWPCSRYDCSPERKCTIHITAWIWEYLKIGDSVIRCENVNSYRVCASYHPSYNETCEFIQYLKPIKIEPCVVPEDANEKKEMLRLLHNTMDCYDEDKVKEIEIFKIDPVFLMNNETNHKKQAVKDDLISSPPRKISQKQAVIDDLLSSPPRKISRKRFLKTDT